MVRSRRGAELACLYTTQPRAVGSQLGHDGRLLPASDPTPVALSAQLSSAQPSAVAGTAHTHDMATTPSSRLLRHNVAVTHSDALFAFLVPSVQLARSAPRACFSTSPARWKRDNNKNRGNSAIRATGLRPRQTLSVRDKDFDKQKLPKPVKVEEKVTGTPDHGLWDFFKDQQLLQTPMVEPRHGSRPFVTLSTAWVD